MRRLACKLTPFVFHIWHAGSLPPALSTVYANCESDYFVRFTVYNNMGLCGSIADFPNIGTTGTGLNSSCLAGEFGCLSHGRDQAVAVSVVEVSNPFHTHTNLPIPMIGASPFPRDPTLLCKVCPPEHFPSRLP